MQPIASAPQAPPHPAHLREAQAAHKGGAALEAARLKGGVQLGAIASGQQGVGGARLARKLKPLLVKAANLY